MNKADFIRVHLIEKGVPADLIRPKPFLWSRYKNWNDVPLVFQSPIKIVFVYSFFSGAFWGGFMWLAIWHIEPERWPMYLMGSAFFGLSVSLIDAYRVYKAQKRLGESNWNNWYKRNYE